MTIKSIVIEGVEEDVTIRRTERGAEATLWRYSRTRGQEDLCIAHITREDAPEKRLAQARVVAAAIYGTDQRGRPAATNSMVHDVLQEMERVAGC